MLDFIPYKRFLLAKLILGFRTFRFNSKKHPYLLHNYNASYANERAVEVSLALHEIKKSKSSHILEIGNVLAHYAPIAHTVVDKYERAVNVINEDALTYNSKKKFDLIISLSTFEHVGFDEEIKDPQKIIAVIAHLKTLLNKKGKLFFTIPIGYNPLLDELIAKDKLPINQMYFLERTSKFNTWKQTTKTAALKKKYNTPYSNANAIMIGILYN